MLGEVKRFLERRAGDPEFRARAESDPRSAADAIGLTVDPVEFRELWTDDGDTTAAASDLAREYSAWRDDLAKQRDEAIAAMAPTDPRIATWRERQIFRCEGQLDEGITRYLPHAPAAFELADGCSVGCDFCSIAAEPFRGHFRRTPTNARLWREVLRVFRSVWGDGVRKSACYWATDPMDNPDYLTLVSDFNDVTGGFPSTTTALSLKSPAETREVLVASRAHGDILVRFSVLSLGMLRKIHREFTAEELLGVELLLQYPEANPRLVRAGRNLKGNAVGPDEKGETNACVTGFLVNMVARSVRLVTPCPADTRWPLGFEVFAEQSFDTPEELEMILEQMIVDHMPGVVRPADRPVLRGGFSYREQEDGFRLIAGHGALSFRNAMAPDGPPMCDLGRLVVEGNRSAEEIAAFFEETAATPPERTYAALNILLEAAVIGGPPRS